MDLKIANLLGLNHHLIEGKKEYQSLFYPKMKCTLGLYRFNVTISNGPEVGRGQRTCSPRSHIFTGFSNETGTEQ
jgi:hypothetical protein